MLTVNIQDAQLQQKIAAAHARLSDLHPLLDSIGAMMESNVRKRFSTRKDPDGQSWQPWAEKTIATYPKKGAHKRLLDRYGDMIKSLSHTVTGADSVRIGFGQPYAVYHEFGTQNMPRRGMLMSSPEAGTLSASDETAVLAIVQKFIDESMG